MRLLNTHTLILTSFTGSTDSLPPFAILSHTWAPDGEITLQDVQAGLLHDAQPPEAKKSGLAKLHGCCHRARLDGYAWAWIDTCCIDKASSAELSEAINSMFSWYQAAGVCYAYLADVSDHGLTGPFLGSSGAGAGAAAVAEFRASRWFTRGWTLQELIAPERVEFFSREWTELGTKRSLEELVCEVTGIELRALREAALSKFPAAAKMRWASGRQTTREEDVAYCLLGLFNVNMPLLYGEGARAFQRLQEEIVRNDGDFTILAWPGGNDDGRSTSAVSALAESPRAFAGSSAILLGQLIPPSRPFPSISSYIFAHKDYLRLY
ncbi:heterokaryon incompatibility protein-domain-containing protein [Schizothecium vesticola]|uniref:Heterokaryon incompatibility protein-domain-containing protein n=1 Tax=Schizothecium vesticola TaxID=314040 RepID=A0AA40F983_9PEZI|nr:heterokaryon incompatibility protein-domain-containing protein [Schizothecium vesticola]